MKDDEVQNYLLNKQPERLCGRFSSSQLQRITLELPQNIFQIQIPLWKRFLVASLIVFSTTLFSCEVNILGAPLEAMEHTSIVASHEARAKMQIPMDTIPDKKDSIGKPKPCGSTKGPIHQTIKGEMMIVTERQVLLGEPALIPVKDTIVVKEEPFFMGKMIAVPKQPVIK
ncbi:MAG: hypothetical protein ABIN36_02315 [Ferruginibacter sp.]